MLMLPKLDNYVALELQQKKIDCLDTSFANFHLCICTREFCEKPKSRESVAVMKAFNKTTKGNKLQLITLDGVTYLILTESGSGL